MYKLVIVDDEHYTVEGMRDIIDWKSYRIEIAGTAPCGKIGYDIILKNNADIVITDIRMQDGDGLWLIEQLRKRSFHGEIIILSGYQDFKYAQKAIDMKVEKYLLKPIDIDELKKTIVNIVAELDARGGGRPEETQREEKPSDLMNQILDYIDLNYTNDIQLQQIANYFYCGVSNLSKLFKKYLNMNFIDYVTMKRINKAKELLLNSSLCIDEIIYAVGYQDPKHFRSIFKKSEGMSPGEYRNVHGYNEFLYYREKIN